MAKSSAKTTRTQTTSPGRSTGSVVAENPVSAFIPGKNLSLQDLFTGDLKDTYWAEVHLVASLPKMIAATATSALKDALTNHLQETVTHVSRLEEIFTLLGEEVVAKKCDAMEGLTISGEHVIEDTVAGTAIRDSGIIMSGLKVENFEITVYRGLIQLATALGKTDLVPLLQATLDEEIAAADLLQSLSDSTLKQVA